MSRQFEEKLKSIFVQLVKSGFEKEEIKGEKICISNLPFGEYNLRIDFENVSVFIPRLINFEIEGQLSRNIGFDNAYVSSIKRGVNNAT